MDGLIGLGKLCQARGWTLAAGGNFSLVTGRNPLRLAITPSGVQKGELSASDFVTVDGETGLSLERDKKPSDETLLHLMIARNTDAGAIAHTHSIWGTILSEQFANEGGIFLSGYEMLKGLSSIKTHDHREWVPVLENSQEMRTLALNVKERLLKERNIHAFLLRKHGLYTWGKNPEEAKRHVEVFEFLFETEGRLHGAFANS